jgi:hypothetical protein
MPGKPAFDFSFQSMPSLLLAEVGKRGFPGVDSYIPQLLPDAKQLVVLRDAPR